MYLGCVLIDFGKFECAVIISYIGLFSGTISISTVTLHRPIVASSDCQDGGREPELSPCRLFHVRIHNHMVDPATNARIVVISLYIIAKTMHSCLAKDQII